MTVLAVVLSLVFGTLFAILLDRKFFGQGIVRTLLITPFLLMPVVAALIWKQQMFSSLFGILDKVLDLPRLQLRARSSPTHPLASIVTVLVWQWTPFMMLIMLAGLQSQPVGHPRGGRRRRRHAVRDLPAADAAAPAPLPRARRAARLDLHRAGVRRDRRDDRRRARARRTSRTSSTRSRSAAGSATGRRPRTRSSSSSSRSSSRRSRCACCPGLLKDEERA